VPITQALGIGQRFTFAFRAKAAAAETIPLSFQARQGCLGPNLLRCLRAMSGDK
jgi:hypothetical protein